MKKIIVITVIAFLSYYYTTAQNNIPVFNSTNIELKFSKFLNGCMKDSLNTVGNNLVYRLKGQQFGENGINLPLLSDGFSGKSNRSTPWETLTELVAAYQQKDVRKIKELYNSTSQEKVSKVFDGENAQVALDALSACGKVKVMMGFEYKDGYYAIVETEKYGINSNYFVKEKGIYKLSYLDEKSAITWNLSLYWKFKPKPFLQPAIVTLADSISFTETKDFNFKVSAAKNWVIIFSDRVGSPVTAYVQDGGYRDDDNLEQQIKLAFEAKILLSKGNYNLFILESNYPVQVVNEEMKAKAVPFKLKVY